MHGEVISYAWPLKILAGVFKNYLKTFLQSVNWPQLF